ncbi:MAG: NADH:flavin oxidoreductase, partial [Deltaproteobacteria bacterium]|nr:NADH:flavin oxidoreductase [Deltaproteobacteria bacterium]
MGAKYRHVFAPTIIRGVDFKNRILLAPPYPNLANDEGRVTNDFVDLFRSFAKGGVAVINVGNSMIDYKEARDEERQLDLSTDDCILPMTRYVEACLGFGAQPNLEVNHNGKDSDFDRTGMPAYSASSFIPPIEKWRARMSGREPRPTIEMDQAKIDSTVYKYGAASLRCKKAGFNMVMI